MTEYVGSEHDSYPYSAVVYIEATFPNNTSYIGSGAVVGENDVLTASHIIYSPQDGGLADDITVYPGKDGYVNPYGVYEASSASYFEVDQDGDSLLSTQESEDDLAVLGFDAAFGYDTGWFDLDPNQGSGFYNLSGYPSVYADASGPRMTNDYGYVSEDPYDLVFQFSSLEANPGNSGGPLWYEDEAGASVIGVVSTSGWAVDVYSHYAELLDWIADNDPVNKAPTAVADQAETPAGTAVTIDVLANDSDPDGDSLELVSVEDPGDGNAEITGSGQITYLPAEGFAGEDSFDYTVSDSKGATAEGLVTVSVNPAQAEVLAQETVLLTAGSAVQLQELVLQANPAAQAAGVWVKVWESNTEALSGSVTEWGEAVKSNQWVSLDSGVLLQAGQLEGQETIWLQTWSQQAGKSAWEPLTLVTKQDGQESCFVSVNGLTPLEALLDGEAAWAKVWQSNTLSSSATVVSNGQELDPEQWFPVDSAFVQGASQAEEEALWFKTWSLEQGIGDWEKYSVHTVNYTLLNNDFLGTAAAELELTGVAREGPFMDSVLDGA
jgi:V8-like Glu-specific endopeptidase